jgi:5-methylcytosine-specific restriction endonuclease McrA
MSYKIIAKALRVAFLEHPPRRAVLNKAMTSNGKYVCNLCKKPHNKGNVQVDHINPVGTYTDWETYISKVFVPEDQLQVLCVPCHSKKTSKDVQVMRELKKDLRPKTLMELIRYERSLLEKQCEFDVPYVPEA